MIKVKGLEKAAGLITALVVVYYAVGIYKHILQIKDIKNPKKKADQNLDSNV